ncbi:hypothetical protein CRG98_013406 [Punica granatum]|uniref:Uncharacterized protein n=1 Tax=Punica granatum TaxID=22663 RepID=A0A2I0KCI0_PUNGR|nr:hypothetical protein CRG98_013406 [Punica granatum]
MGTEVITDLCVEVNGQIGNLNRQARVATVALAVAAWPVRPQASASPPLLAKHALVIILKLLRITLPPPPVEVVASNASGDLARGRGG